MLLRIVDGSDDDLSTLLDLFNGYDELRGQTRSVWAAPGPGEMGAAIEALSIALVPGGAATIIAGGVALWLRRRAPGRPGKLGLRLELPDGTKLYVDAKGVDDVEAVVAAAVKPWTESR
ncbi:hypothetical protein AB0B63_23180 [Micromonospora sp. NPDC049081]|uniref:effector-associated constant component EACC1 n=1 Tax=Micromonospora sp. NPDC049081 TaxID=3155150 RepID=UPI00340B6AC7